jgi:hypothetical protein
MYPTLLQALASQRTAEMRTAAASGHRPPAQPSNAAWQVRQRIGWALVQVGLRLAVRREPA